MKKISNIKNVQARGLSLGEYFLSLMLRTLPIKHGKHRLLDRIAPKIRNKSGKLLLISVHGSEVIVDPGDLVGWHFAMLKSFDPEVVEILKKACNPTIKEVFWDIGANKGACFCSLATNLPLLQVVAIEPQSQLSEVNILNLESVCSGRYEYVRTGIGEEEGELTLVIPESNLGRASLHIQQSGPNDVSEKITIQTASQICRNSKYGWPTIAKIDVEGHEPQVFMSLIPCFDSQVCKVIIFENHASETEAFDTIESLTKTHGYRIYGIRKTPWSTTLVPAKKQLLDVTDYAVIRGDLLKENRGLAKLVREK